MIHCFATESLSVVIFFSLTLLAAVLGHSGVAEPLHHTPYPNFPPCGTAEPLHIHSYTGLLRRVGGYVFLGSFVRHIFPSFYMVGQPWFRIVHMSMAYDNLTISELDGNGSCLCAVI